MATIIAKYPKGYEGKKFMTEGESYQVGEETAELLVSRGLGELVENKTVDSSQVEESTEPQTIIKTSKSKPK